ncbi:pseudouridine synthase [Nitzschia inconspicua]|uniref:Pseudouridine synthase n=1 Tax=Nitzschia inconspicua TaxID=303405 RepID=A0A9K3PH00_9STRA|nr:pseudouridine synthase [Nitzschia inconspicua]
MPSARNDTCENGNADHARMEILLCRKISIIHEEEEFVVINKPFNLRSVPGHAKNDTTLDEDVARQDGKNDKRKRKRQQTSYSNDEPKDDEDSSRPEGNPRRTAQEAWVLALNSLPKDFAAISQVPSNLSAEHSALMTRVVSDLVKSSHSSIPRKRNLFVKYIQRNQKRLLRGVSVSTPTELDLVANELHEVIQARMKDYMNLPQATSPEESALGQLENLHGTRNVGGRGAFHVVHRLDCETSGVMVFAKSRAAASFLCKAWRAESHKVSNSDVADAKAPGVEKVYVAMVREWPPYHQRNETSGMIDIPLEPSKTERLKWQVADSSNARAKPSQTKWKVLSHNQILPDWYDVIYESANGDKSVLGEDSKMKTKMTGLILELRPLTGRTHQLRVHCAHIGSGIVGDSLYGKDRISDTYLYDPNNACNNEEDGPRLMLHACELTFPWPRNEHVKNRCEPQFCTFSAWPKWYDPLA